MMLALLGSVVVFSVAAMLVLRWAANDLAKAGKLSAKSVVASWLLYVFHADTVATAAWMGAVSVGVPRAAALVAGAALAVSGFAIFLTATIVLVRDGDFEGPRTRGLVTAGPYRRSRHPQNLGWGIMLLGIAIAGRSLVAVALVGLFAVFIERYARLEEDQLQRDFGDSYAAYRTSTPAIMSLTGVRAARATHVKPRRRADGT